MMHAQEAAELLQAAGDVNRLRILKCLQVRSCRVSELVEATGIPQPRVSRHLGILRNAGLVQMIRDGQWVECACVGDDASPEVRALLDFVVEWVPEVEEVARDRERLAGLADTGADGKKE